MTRPFVVRNLIVDYLVRVKDERTVTKITRYMYRYHKVNPSATCTHLSNLTNEGLIMRIERGRYQAMP